MKEDFIKEWLDLKDKNPDKLSEYAVTNDRWDRKYFGQMLEAIDDFMINHERLCDKVETGSPMWADLFWLLWKVEPSMLGTGEIKPSHLINMMVGKETSDIADFRRLKYFSEGDDVASALACIDLRETIEALFDKLNKLREKLQQIQDLMRQMAGVEDEEHDLDEMEAQWREGFNPDSEEDQQQERTLEEQRALINARLEQLKQAMEEAGEEAKAEADAAGPVIRGMLKNAMKGVADNAENVHSQQDLWGDDPGQLQRLPADERMELARRLQNDRFKNLLKLIGPMRRIMEEAQMRKVNYARDEVYRVTLGNDIPHVLPSELAKIHHPLAKYEFYRKYIERELPQYDLRGKERVGKGEIIACLDNSGSMQGQKEMWGKAVAICSLHLARKQKRGFYGVHFGSAREIKTFDFGVNADYSVQSVLDYAEFFFNGGTDFMRPLSLALDRLRSEHAATGKVKGDIMFITDGICNVHPDWLAEFKSEQQRLEFTVWGFLIGGYGRDSGPLNDICDGKMWEIKDLLDPKDTRDMFGEM